MSLAGQLQVEFICMDPAVPIFRFTCKKCGKKWEGKTEWDIHKALVYQPGSDW